MKGGRCGRHPHGRMNPPRGRLPPEGSAVLLHTHAAARRPGFGLPRHRTPAPTPTGPVRSWREGEERTPRSPMIPPDAPTPMVVGRKTIEARLPNAPPIRKIINHVAVPHIASSSEPI